MAYVPGFRNDIFVSYAHVDDIPAPGVERGWVSTLIRALQAYLSRELGQHADVYSLWMDNANLRPQDGIAPAIIENIQQSATLLVVLSRGYLASEWCRKESNTFFDALKSRPRGEGTIFVVTTDKLDRNLWPSELRDVIGYDFWSEDPATGRISVLDYPPSLRKGEGFSRRVAFLASDICQTLQKLSQSAPSEPPPAEPVRSVERPPTNIPTDLAQILEAKLEKGEYDVFLCHNTEDKPEVKDIGKLLMKRGILPWLDEWDLQPGVMWQLALEQQMTTMRAAAVFVGESGFGPWQNMELLSFLRQFVARRCPVIPVLLASCKQTPDLPSFLGGFHFVDFRKSELESLDQLIWGITGKRRNIESRT